VVGALDSQSTVKRISKAISELKSNPKIGRAEAVRQSMLLMISKGDKGEDYEAHPAFWAPFVLSVKAPQIKLSQIMRCS
jgi:CHAT domain-containing protein